MKKSKTAGFTVVEVLVILVVLLIIGSAGSYVFNKNRDSSKKKAVATQQASTAKGDADKTTDSEAESEPINYPSKNMIKSYTLPPGWETADCDTGEVAIIPAGTSDLVCESTENSPIMTMAVQDNHNYIDPTNCEVTRVKENTASRGLLSYDCRNIKIDEYDGIRQISVEEKAKFVQANTYISYTFPAAGRLLVIDYIRYTDEDSQDFTADFDKFVTSFKFN